MPNHKPHTYSNEDVLFLKETLQHCLDADAPPKWNHGDPLYEDIDRCIKILESENG